MLGSNQRSKSVTGAGAKDTITYADYAFSSWRPQADVTPLNFKTRLSHRSRPVSGTTRWTEILNFARKFVRLLGLDTRTSDKPPKGGACPMCLSEAIRRDLSGCPTFVRTFVRGVVQRHQNGTSLNSKSGAKMSQSSDENTVPATDDDSRISPALARR